jgi:hypothetical protein
LIKLAIGPQSVLSPSEVGQLPARCYAIAPFFPVARNEQQRKSQLGMHFGKLRGVGNIEQEGFVIPPFSKSDWGIAWLILSPKPEIVPSSP